MLVGASDGPMATQIRAQVAARHGRHAYRGHSAHFFFTSYARPTRRWTHANQDRVRAHDEAGVTDNKQNMVAATHDIDADTHREFFDAYVTALKNAFVDHEGDNETQILLIDDIYHESIANVYGVSIRLRWR